MARPLKHDARTDILDGLDRKPISSVNDICDYLKEIKKFHSEQATRRMLMRMCNEGLITELPTRGNHNKVLYTKMLMPNVARLVSPNGKDLTLRAFIHELVNYEDPDSILSPSALTAIRAWMLDVLGSSVPKAYEAKARPVPDEYELRSRLLEVQSMLSSYHKFISQFLKADIWSEYARENLAKEFNTNCVEEHAVIVDRAWLNE